MWEHLCSFGKFGLKALFASCPFIDRAAEAPADHESTNEDFRGCSRDDKPVFIEESTSKAQAFKTVKFSIDLIQRS